jgi:mono/diheme cytochrome c family protein
VTADRVLPRAARCAALRATMLMLPFALGACSWFTDFKSQPSIKPWQVFNPDSAETKGFRGQPSNSVNTNGTLAAGYAISYQPLPATIDSMSSIANPVAVDARSLLNGRKYFTINCAVCHGAAGDANSTMKALNYGFAPSLMTASAMGRTDGYIWGMLRNGRGLMPSANRIEEQERWDVVNYVRGLQGKYPVDTGYVGRPGETGENLPGYTKLGPTVPSKYVHPVVSAHPKQAEHGASAEAPAAKEVPAVTKPEEK